MLRSRTILALCAALVCLPLVPVKANDSTDASYRAEIDAWHAKRVERLERPTGWLSLIALDTLGPGENRLGSGAANDILLPGFAPREVGRIDVGDGTYRFVAAPGVEATVDDSVVTDLFLQHDQQPHPTFVRVGRVLFYVIERGGQPYLRVKDTESPLIADFQGIDRWPVDRAWRIEAKWEAYDPPKSIAVADVLGDVNQEDCPGAAVFEHDGKSYRLEPTVESDGSIFLVFGDETNGVTSYGGGRFLYLDPPQDGKIVVDFNKAYDPPCNFTPYATCPLPPAGNHLDFEVTAGEKVWGEGHH